MKHRSLHGRFGRSLILLLLLGLSGCGKPGPTKSVETGYRGAAKGDPFLAAERFLEELGHPVQVRASFARALPSATVIAPSQAFANARESRQVLNWAGAGGHLIVLLQGGEYWLDDWKSDFWEAVKAKRKEENAPILEELGVTVSEVKSPRQEAVTVKGHAFRMSTLDGFSFNRKPPTQSPTLAVGQPDHLSLYSYTFGTGRITILANAHPFRNRYIGEPDHAGLLRALVELESNATVYFFRAHRGGSSNSMFQPEFLRKLWDRGWMAVLALGVLIILWIWKNLPRFGPPLTPEDRTARSFTENLLLTGAFLWRYRRTSALLDPMRRELTGALTSRGWSVDDPAMVQDLATRSGLPPARVAEALRGDLPTDRLAFQKLVEDLQNIRAKI